MFIKVNLNNDNRKVLAHTINGKLPYQLTVLLSYVSFSIKYSVYRRLIIQFNLMKSLIVDVGESSEDEVSERIRRRSTINLGNQRQRNIRRLRLKVYNFLEKPLNAASAPYHFSIFGLVLSNIILGAATNQDEGIVSIIHFYLEIFMIIFLIVEFVIRLWSVKADAKYKRKWGRIYYLFHTITIIDLFIIPATIMLLVFEGNFVDGKTLDNLRFIQILRLLHVDRQMATWKLLRKMIFLSKWQLLSAYYITFVIVITMATIIYSTEAWALNIQDTGYALNSTDNSKHSTFPTMAHSWWFTIVTVLTIGYGDIVPIGATTKIVVCALGFIAFCTFQAANTQISVGMTLMMEEENKEQCKVRLRNLAASTIQCWYRYHLATHWKSHRKYVYFTHVCYKLYVTEERINQNRELAKRIKEKLEKRRTQKKKSLTYQSSVTAEILRMGIKGAVKPVVDTEKSVERKTSVQWRSLSERRRSSLPETFSLPDSAVKRRVMFAEAHNQTVETSMSSSCDISDIENHIELKNILEENIDNMNPRDVDITLLMKYRPLLRFFNFVMFRFLMKKFQIQRKAGELLVIEAEIAERENARNVKMKELEAAIIALAGKPTISPFDPSGLKISAIDRVIFCEQKIRDIEDKLGLVNDYAMKCLNLLDNASFEIGRPPKHPGRSETRRQVTISDQYEFVSEENN